MLGVDRHALRIAWTWFLFALLVLVVYLIRDTLMTFALAVFVALLLAPLVSLVERLTPAWLPRTAALGIVYVALIGIAAAILLPVVSAVIEDARMLGEQLPSALVGDPLHRMPLPDWLEPARDRIAAILTERMDDISRNAMPLLARALGQLLTGIGALVGIVLVPILAFLFLAEGRTMFVSLLQEFPASQRPLAAEIYSDLRVMLAQYVRALVILASVAFLCYFLFLELTGAPYAALLAGMAGVLEFIPAAGPLLAAFAILLISLASGYPHWLGMLAFFIVYRVLQDYVLQPKLMSSGVKVPPLLVIFGALAGASLAGIPGVFFSVPAMAAVRIIFERLHRRHAVHA